MGIILVFAVFVIIGDAVAVAISRVVESFSQPASLFVFLGLFVVVFWAAWQAAVVFTERYLVRSDSKS